MARIINITDKFSTDKPKIQFGEKLYEVNNSMKNVMGFEELLAEGKDGMEKAIRLSLGEEAATELGVENISMGNFKVLMVSIMAANLDIDYEEAEARFQQKEQSIQ